MPLNFRTVFVIFSTNNILEGKGYILK